MSQDGNDPKKPLNPQTGSPPQPADGKSSPQVTLSKPPPRPPTPVAPPRPATPVQASVPPAKPSAPVAPPKVESPAPVLKPAAPSVSQAPAPVLKPAAPAVTPAPAPAITAVSTDPAKPTTPPAPQKSAKEEEEAKRAALAAALANLNKGANSASGSKFINVFVVGSDLAFAKIVQTSLTSLQTNNPGTTYRVFPGVQKDKLMDFLNKYKFHSILLEEEFTDGNPASYLKEFKESLKKTSQNVNVPVILVSSKTDLNRTKNYIKAGYKDQLIKPLDQTLFLQKMNMYNKEVRLTEDNLLFSMDIAKDVDVGFYFKTKTISEFGMTMHADKSVEAGSVVTIYASFLNDHIAAVVSEVTKANEGYTLTLMFIGLTPAQTQEIRKFIRAEYAEEKNAS